MSVLFAKIVTVCLFDAKSYIFYTEQATCMLNLCLCYVIVCSDVCTDTQNSPTRIDVYCVGGAKGAHLLGLWPVAMATSTKK